MEKKKLILIILILGLIAMTVYNSSNSYKKNLFSPDDDYNSVRGCSTCDSCDSSVGKTCQVNALAWMNVQNHKKELGITTNEELIREYEDINNRLNNCLSSAGYSRLAIFRLGFFPYNKKGKTPSEFFKPTNDLVDCKNEVDNAKGLNNQVLFSSIYSFPTIPNNPNSGVQRIDNSLFNPETCDYFINKKPGEFFVLCVEARVKDGHCDKCELKKCEYRTFPDGTVSTTAEASCHRNPTQDPTLEIYSLTINPSGSVDHPDYEPLDYAQVDMLMLDA